MKLEVRADDTIPWGPCCGMTLREVYKKKPKRYFKLINDTEHFSISEKTMKIIEGDVEEVDKTRPTFSKGAKLNKFELKENDTLIGAGGDYEGYTLKEIFDENESYFRYLALSNVYFISEATLDHLLVLKYGESFLKKRTRDELSVMIDRKINGFHFNEDEIYSDKDLIPYIGETVTTAFSEETTEVINEDIFSDKYQLDAALKEVYGKNARFRDGQKEAVLAVLNGKKTLVIQHTGWGKSLVYFLSIKKLREAGKGPAIIISPLLALMHNQIDATKKFGIVAKSITSDTQKDWNRIYVELSINKLDAVIISPERLGDEKFTNFMNSYISKISLLVVDEAHCISDWGHDFRPDFRRIVKLIRKLPDGVPVLATTATANDRVVRDIKYQLASCIISK